MRTLDRNRREIWYAQYEGKEAIRDENGLLTGDYKLLYGEPQKLLLNYSAGVSRINLTTFGISEDYDRAMVTTDLDCPIEKMTRLWLGIEPAKPYNYVVSGKADSINSILYALKEVEVTP